MNSQGMDKNMQGTDEERPFGLPESSLPQHRVLVLNRLWQAVNIVGVRRAFALLFQEHAKVIHSDTGTFEVMEAGEWIEFSQRQPARLEDDMIHTVRLAIRIPRILLLNDFDRIPVQEVKFTRENIFERDRYTCQYCGQPFSARDLNLDHIIPRDRGGRTTWENLTTSCVRCNSRKGNRLPHEAGMRLLAKPTRPRWRPFAALARSGPIHESWVNFLHADKDPS